MAKDIGGGARESVASTGPSKAETVRTDKDLNMAGITDSELPVHMAGATDRECQWAPKAQNAGGNISGHDPEVELLMVPDFQGQSGQGANQDTLRPKGSA
jgi:hypothetical protein